MRFALLAPFCFLASVAVPAQQKPATTVVSGHVYCADTNAPARMASVLLEPAAALEAITPGTQKPVASDNEHRQIANPPGSMPPSRTETHTLRRYGTTQQRIQVLGETTGLTLAVPDPEETKAQTP